MHQIYTSDGLPAHEARKTWDELSRREFFNGEIEVEGDFENVTLEKALSFPIALSRIKSNTRLSLRRSSKDIRDNKVGFRIIWFVRRGSLKIVRAQGACTIQAGELGILDSNVPFFATLQGEGDSAHESFQAVVPPDVFLSHLQPADKFTDALSLNSPDGELVNRLLDILIENGDRIGRQAAKPLAESLLEAIAENLRSINVEVPRRQSLIDRRLMDIENYILMNLTDPELSYEKVAASCGISPRYLCYVLKANNTSFSELLWQNRLPKARDWLVLRSTRDYPIHEIAYMSGFKSAAHFSRMFRRAYGCPPREYRAAQIQLEDAHTNDNRPLSPDPARASA